MRPICGQDSQHDVPLYLRSPMQQQYGGIINPAETSPQLFSSDFSQDIMSTEGSGPLSEYSMPAVDNGAKNQRSGSLERDRQLLRVRQICASDDLDSVMADNSDRILCTLIMSILNDRMQ